jgi:DNA-binding LacI/PurR family transcriptional regulator
LERAVTNHKIDGVILTRTLKKDMPLAYLKEKQIPFVTIGSTEDTNVVQIDNDHRSACRELTARLLGQGIRDIVLIGGEEEHIVNDSRLRGFQDALAEAKERQGKSRVFLNVTSGLQVEQIVEKELAQNTDCIVVMDDFLCGCVLNALFQRGVSVPRDVKVASFYDSTLLANYTPSVTSIRFDVEELGRKACERLLGMLNGETVERKTLLGYEIKMRNSTT